MSHHFVNDAERLATIKKVRLLINALLILLLCLLGVLIYLYHTKQL
jgi:hypothetical protein